jgi:hypothetical protein
VGNGFEDLRVYGGAKAPDLLVKPVRIPAAAVAAPATVSEAQRSGAAASPAPSLLSRRGPTLSAASVLGSPLDKGGRSESMREQIRIRTAPHAIETLDLRTQLPVYERLRQRTDAKKEGLREILAAAPFASAAAPLGNSTALKSPGANAPVAGATAKGAVAAPGMTPEVARALLDSDVGVRDILIVFGGVCMSSAPSDTHEKTPAAPQSPRGNNAVHIDGTLGFPSLDASDCNAFDGSAYALCLDELTTTVYAEDEAEAEARRQVEEAERLEREKEADKAKAGATKSGSKGPVPAAKSAAPAAGAAGKAPAGKVSVPAVKPTALWTSFPVLDPRSILPHKAAGPHPTPANTSQSLRSLGHQAFAIIPAGAASKGFDPLDSPDAAAPSALLSGTVARSLHRTMSAAQSSIAQGSAVSNQRQLLRQGTVRGLTSMMSKASIGRQDSAGDLLPGDAHSAFAVDSALEKPESQTAVAFPLILLSNGVSAAFLNRSLGRARAENQQYTSDDRILYGSGSDALVILELRDFTSAKQKADNILPSIGDTDEFGSVIMRYPSPGCAMLVRRALGDGVFEGETENGKKHGVGIYRFNNGDIYEGSFFEDQFGGQGRMQYHDGRTYTGTWKNGLFGGPGRMEWSLTSSTNLCTAAALSEMQNGSLRNTANVQTIMSLHSLFDPTAQVCLLALQMVSYEGAWAEGLPDGEGEAVYADGARYKGQMMGAPNGVGELRFESSATRTTLIIQGTWKAGYLHGPLCSWVFESPKVSEKYKGGFANGFRDGEGAFERGDGSTYEGHFKRGKRNGLGRASYTDQSVYEGKYKAGMRHGKGTCLYGNGDIFVGFWEEDKRHGEGTLRKATGLEIVGSWDNDRLVPAAVD